MTDFSGKTIKGYELNELLGSGGFGSVYRAYQSLLKREVAIKIIHPQYANHPDFIRKFEIEAQIVARLESARIVPLYDYWREPDSAYLVMRYFRGGSLQTSLKNGHWSAQDTSRLLDQIAEALTIAHRHQVIHRDVKPDNILLDDDLNAYLADFGIAKDLTGPRYTVDEDTIVGSPMYMSPEQIQSKPVTPQTDVYCLGMVLYEMLTGTTPYPESNTVSLIMLQLNEPIPDLVEIRPDLPEALNIVIQKATAKNPEDRHEDVASLAAEFRYAVSHLNDGTNDSDATTHLTLSPEWLPETQPITESLPEPENPYKGLRAFQEFDADDFFGRETLVQRLVERLKSQGEIGRLLAVIGPSGSGKSSAVRAGLLPMIRNGALPNSDEWFITEMIPGTHPLEELEAALLRVAVKPPDSLLGQITEDERGFARAVKRILPGDSDNELLLLIDQFEEIFTLWDDEEGRSLFLNSLLAIANDSHSRVRIVLTLRADFYDRPLLYPEFGELIRNATEVVLPLNAAELEQAIVGPAQRAGLQIESGLPQAIINDIAEQPGALPLLQYALSELYERREGRRLTLVAYEDSGRVAGALARRADELFENLSEEGQDLAQHLFLRLITPGEGTEDTRRRIPQAQVYTGSKSDDILQSIIELFGDFRLLTFDREPVTRAPTVEIAHEALIRQWPRLRQWIEDSREDLQVYRRVAQSTQDWMEADRDPSFLASGTRLAQYEEWVEETVLVLNQQEREYLEASIAERQRQQEEEKARREHEAMLEQRSRNRLRALVSVLAVATVIALALTAFAFNQSDAAQRSAVTATVAQGQALVEAENAATAAAVAEMNAQEAKSMARISNAELALRNNNTELAIALALDANQQGRSTIESQRTLANAAYAPGARRLYSGHEGWVVAVDFSPDNQKFLSGSRDNRVVEWNVESGEAIQTLLGHDDWIWDVAYSPDGERAISASQDRTLILWDLNTGQMIRRFEGHEGTVSSVVFSSDGATILSGSFDDTMILWDVETGEIIRRFEGHTGDIYDVAFSPSGFTALSGADDQTLILWNIQSGQALRTFGGDGIGHTSGIWSVAYTPDESGAVSASNDHNLILWSFETGEPERYFTGHSARVTNVAFNPDGQSLLSTAEDNTVILWDFATATIKQRYAGQSGPLYALDFSADGNHFLTGGWDDDIRLWDINNGAEIQRFDGHTAPVYWVEYSPDGQQALSGSADSTVILWNIASGEIIHRLEGHSEGVNSVAFSPDGTQALSGSDDFTLILWDLETGEMIRQFGANNDGHTDAVWVVKFSPDGTQALSGSVDNSLMLWDLETGEQLRRFIGHRRWINDVEFLPDGKRALSASFDTTMILWDLETGEQIRTYTGHEDWVNSVALTADGTKALSASADSTLILWEVETARRLRQYEGHDTQVLGLAMNPEGTIAVSSSNDTTIILWDVASGEILHRYNTQDIVRAVALSNDETTLLSGSGEQGVKLWRIELNLDNLVTWTKENRYVRDFTCSERERFRLEPLCPAPTVVPDLSSRDI